MILKIAHLSDIHIRKTPTRNLEYEIVFKNLIKSLTEIKPERIAIAGDLVHDYLDLQGEQLIMASNLLNDLSKIAPVRITRGNHDCFTPEHEVLTHNGWVRLDDYINNNNDTDVLTFNQEKNIFEFQKPIELIKKDFVGNMKKITADKCEMIVTPTHEILLKNAKTKKYLKTNAIDLIPNENKRIPVVSNEVILESDLYFELLGFCLADATFVIKNKNTLSGRVQFHFKKERKINYLVGLLNSLNIKHTIRIGDKNRNTVVMCIYSEVAKNIMKFFDYKKELTWKILDNDKIKLKSFIDGYLNGDGHDCGFERFVCNTIHKLNSEILSTISNYVGYNSHITNGVIFGNYKNSKQQYRFFISKNGNETTKIKNVVDFEYSGNVYCLSVPNENLYIRYNNRCFITGNCRRKSLNRVDSVKAIVETLHNDRVIYYDSTGFFEDENIIWAVWHHGEKNNNPWKTKEAKKFSNDTEHTFIDLFHDPINGCKSATGFDMNSKSYYKISDFKGDISMFGDIHLLQYLDKRKTKAYCSSLIAQDITEGDDAFHGYLLWDVQKKIAEEIAIESDYSYKNVRITPYTDFDDLDFEIENPTKHMTIRFVWCTLPQTRCKDAERKLVEYVKKNHSNCKFTHKNLFIEEDKIELNENITLENISTKIVQHEVFKEYLTKIGVEDKTIADVIALDEEITNSIDITEDSSVEWNVIKFGAKNFMSYGEIDIDWRDKDGVFQIVGKNTAGKTTILKSLCYVLYGKTLETETRVKYGDMRFVNNRNGAKSCEAYIVIEGNGEYYGIKRRTDIATNKSGEITGAPTTLNYYLLSSADDEMKDDVNSFETLTDDVRTKTQNKINSIIGTYDNFMRIVMTTSDTLNRILSNDMAVFIDSLLFDSGLDIFDKKLEGFKLYQKKINEKARVNCNVEAVTVENLTLTKEIEELDINITDIEITKLPEVQNRIQTGRTYVETLTKKLYKIDPEINNLNVDKTNEDIKIHNKSIDDLKAREVVINNSIIPLKKTYDEVRLAELNLKKDANKTEEYNSKLQIKEIERKIGDVGHEIEIINGKVHALKLDGVKKKNEITELKESKICITCGQMLQPEHQKHIDDKIKIIEIDMFKIGDDIKKELKVIEEDKKPLIVQYNKDISEIKTNIENKTLEMEDVLKEIGDITNDINDVNTYNELLNELQQIPTKIQNNQLKIDILQGKIDSRDNSLKQIEENMKIEKGIALAKDKLLLIESEEHGLREDILIYKNNISVKQTKIKNNEILLKEFKAQEYQDLVASLYKKCVHRDGMPRQILCEYILPKINITLEKILQVVEFKIWLDVNDLRPKLSYNDRPNAIIDCISASGKERTFSSVVLKFALNQINVKAKPTIFLLDEVMGKLDLEGSIEEFVEILQLIKNNMKKIMIIEQSAEVNPDYLISCTLDENGISSAELN